MLMTKSDFTQFSGISTFDSEQENANWYVWHRKYVHINWTTVVQIKTGFAYEYFASYLMIVFLR